MFHWQSKTALKIILEKCTFLPGLEPLLHDAPSNILKYVLCQFSKVSESLFQSCKHISLLDPRLHLCSVRSQVLPHDTNARRLFMISGGLKKVQEIQTEPGSLLQEYIDAIKGCFPEEIVRYRACTH